MTTTQTHRSPDELARLGTEILERRIKSMLRPEDDGNFIAIDVDSGDHEIDEDDYSAVTRLQDRRPHADIWLGCIGQPTAYRMRTSR